MSTVVAIPRGVLNILCQNNTLFSPHPITFVTYGCLKIRNQDNYEEVNPKNVEVVLLNELSLL